MSATTLRPLTPADIPAAQALTASFGWPHRREDWAQMQSLGHGVVAERDGFLAGTAMCWRYGDDWATLGLIAVAQALQGQGMGRRLMLAVIGGLEGRKLALHATAAGTKLYREIGFKPTGTIVQHQGGVSQPGTSPDGLHLRPVTSADLPRLAVLDREAVGMNRSDLLAALLQSASGVAIEDQGSLTGFALVRRFGHGLAIGPVAAPGADGAQAMIGHLLSPLTGQFVRIDVPESCGLGPWLLRLGLAEVGTVIRMVRGHDTLPSQRARTFGLASQAFG